MKTQEAMASERAEERANYEMQGKEYLARIAELQMRENTLHENQLAAEEALQKQHAEELAEHERQNKQYLQRIAELQMRENSLRDEHQSVESTIQAQQNMVRQLEESMEHMKDELRLAASRLEAAERQDAEYAQVRSEKAELEQRLAAMAKATEQIEEVQQDNKELLIYGRPRKNSPMSVAIWKQWRARSSNGRTPSRSCRRNAISMSRNGPRRERRAEAAEAAKSAPVSTAVAAVSPEAIQAAGAIRQQMQEMQALLAWLRPANKQTFPKAA